MPLRHLAAASVPGILEVMACLTLLAAAAAYVIKTSVHSRGEALKLGLTCFVWWLAFVGLAMIAGDRRSHNLERELTSLAASYAVMLEAHGLGRISAATLPDDPTYLQLIELQKALLSLNPGLRDIYTLARDPEDRERIYFLVDSETDYNRDGKYDQTREQRTNIGEDYASDGPNAIKAFGGAAAFDDIPYTDKWGTWVSAYQPIYAGSGDTRHQIGIVGVDFSGSSWTAVIWETHMAVMLVGTMLAIILLMMRRSHVQALPKETARYIKEGSIGKADSIAHLAGGLAHDFNNLLGIVIGNIDLVKEQLLPEQESAIKACGIAAKASRRGIGISRALLTISRQTSLDRITTNIGELMQGVMPLLENAAGTNVRVRSHLTSEPLTALIDPAQLGNILLNLVINATDAIVQCGITDGIIHIRSTANTIEEKDQTLNPVTYALLEITDNGPGMEEKTRQKATDSYFTTKGMGKGTGLGLSMAATYAKELGGRLEIKSEVGKGTTVSILIPLTDAAVTAMHQATQVRLTALERMEVLDTQPEDKFDSIAKEAARIAGVPFALISLVTDKRQWFKAKTGLAITETPYTWSICAHTIREPHGLLNIDDLSTDYRFSGSPLVDAEEGFKFYYGVALHDGARTNVGALCVLDKEPHDLTPQQITQLIKLGDDVSKLLAARVKRGPADSEQGETSAPAARLTRVLLVDDEEELLKLERDWLKSQGLQVAVAEDSASALILLTLERFDMLITDVSMPGKNGLELAEAARQLHPDISILVVSGYSKALLDGECPYEVLFKPYRKTDFLASMNAEWAAHVAGKRPAKTASGVAAA